MSRCLAHTTAGVSNLLFSSGVGAWVLLGGSVANPAAAAVAITGMAYVGIENLRATVDNGAES